MLRQREFNCFGDTTFFDDWPQQSWRLRSRTTLRGVPPSPGDVCLRLLRHTSTTKPHRPLLSQHVLTFQRMSHLGRLLGVGITRLMGVWRTLSCRELRRKIKAFPFFIRDQRMPSFPTRAREYSGVHHGRVDSSNPLRSWNNVWLQSEIIIYGFSIFSQHTLKTTCWTVYSNPITTLGGPLCDKRRKTAVVYSCAAFYHGQTDLCFIQCSIFKLNEAEQIFYTWPLIM